MRMYVLPVLITASAALAQSSVIIDVESPVLLPGQSTTVTMWAAFPASDWAFALISTDLGTSVGATGFSDWRLGEHLDGPGTSPGVPGPGGFEGILAGQLAFPPSGTPGTNPIAFWHVTYTAPAEVGTPFDVELSTLTGRFEVYPTRDSTVGESRLATLTEGHATIHVIPAPAGAVVFGLGVLVAGRRRR